MFWLKRHLISVFVKTAGLSDKSGKFLFRPAKIFGLPDSCSLTLFNRQILLIDIFFFHFLKISFAFAFMFLGKKTLKQYQLNTKIISSNPKLLSVETKICLSCSFSLLPGENFCLTDSPLVALQKFSQRLLSRDIMIVFV